jgi:hypothetical protein
MYRHLSIDIVSDESASSEATAQIVSMASVEKSLDHFFQPEVREIKCEKCSDGTHAQQTLRILSRYVLPLDTKDDVHFEEDTIETNAQFPPSLPTSDQKCYCFI